jgi:hypothetical protein
MGSRLSFVPLRLSGEESLLSQFLLVAHNSQLAAHNSNSLSRFLPEYFSVEPEKCILHRFF